MTEKKRAIKLPRKSVANKSSLLEVKKPNEYGLSIDLGRAGKLLRPEGWQMAVDVIDVLFEHMEMAMNMSRINTIYKGYTIQRILFESLKVYQLRALVADNENVIVYDYDAECMEPEPPRVDQHAMISVIQKPRIASFLEVPLSRRQKKNRS